MDTPPLEFDLAIVGAGIGGASAAIFAAQNGARVVLLEGGVAARHKVCGEFLSPESRAPLAQLGVLDDVWAAGAREVGAARILTSRRTSRAVSFARAGIAISRAALDGILWRHAQKAGVLAWEKTRVKSIERTGGGFELNSTQGVLRARFVVFATGRGSKLGRAEENSTERQVRFVGLKTHLLGATAPPGEVQMFPLSGGYCGLVGVEGGATNACLLLPYARTKGRAPADLWAQLQGENRALAKATQNATLAFDWLATGNVVFDRFAPARDGILRVGDASGTIHPLSGDGMAMALRSAQLAAFSVVHALRWDLPPDVVADNYARMWHHEFDSRLKWAHRLQPLFADARVTFAAQRLFDALPGLSKLALRRTRAPLGS